MTLALLLLAGQGAAALLLAGCDCTSRFLVPLTREERDSLRRAHGDGDLDEATCNKLCIPPDAQGDAGPPASAGEAGFHVTLCHVVQNGSEPALYCSGVPEGGCYD